MIICVDGDNGWGKTLLLAMLSTYIHRPIWSNFTLFKHPQYKELTLAEIIELGKVSADNFPNGLVFYVDEAYGMFESRLSNRAINLYLSYKTNYQWRKRLLDVYLTFQDFSSIDKRFRTRYHIFIQCGYRDAFSKEPFTYHYYRKQKEGADKFIYTRTYSYEYMKQFFNLYDTTEIIEPPQIALSTYKIIKDDMKLLSRQLNIYYDILLPVIKKEPYNDKISHDKLDLLLVSKNILPVYEKRLYTMLNNQIRL